jgi:hypothetical protein
MGEVTAIPDTLPESRGDLLSKVPQVTLTFRVIAIGSGAMRPEVSK